MLVLREKIENRICVQAIEQEVAVLDPGLNNMCSRITVVGGRGVDIVQTQRKCGRVGKKTRV